MLYKKLLIVTYHFPPSAASGAFRLLGFAKHLPSFGWQPLVVAPPQLPWEPVDPQLSWQVPAEAVLRAVPYPASAPKVLRYFAQNAVWLPGAYLACKQMIRDHRPDAILTSGPPHCVHVLGHYLKRKFGTPWLADFRDPWINDGRNKLLSLMQRYESSWERTVFQNADLVLANAPNACRMLRTVHADQRDKIVTLTNGFDPRPGQSQYVASEDACLRLLHAGELYHGRDPMPLLQALAQANADTVAGRSFELNVLGRTEEVNLATALTRHGWNDFVRVLGQRSYRQTLDAMECADILVLFDSPGRKNGVPAKLYEYFRAERPILALAEPDGDVAAVLRDSGVLHRIASPGDQAQIHQALAELREEMDVPAVTDPRRLVRYTRKAITQTLAEMLDSLTGHVDCQKVQDDSMSPILPAMATQSQNSAA